MRHLCDFKCKIARLCISPKRESEKKERKKEGKRRKKEGKKGKRRKVQQKKKIRKNKKKGKNMWENLSQLEKKKEIVSLNLIVYFTVSTILV